MIPDRCYMIPSMNDEVAFGDPGDIWTDVIEDRAEDMLADFEHGRCRWDNNGDGDCMFHKGGCPTEAQVIARLAEGWEVDEMATEPNRSFLMDGGSLLDRISDYAEDAEVTEEWQERLAKVLDMPEVVTAADALLELVASKINYYMAGEVVAKHRISVVDGEPMWDGEPMFVPTSTVNWVSTTGCVVTVRNEPNDGL